MGTTMIYDLLLVVILSVYVVVNDFIKVSVALLIVSGCETSPYEDSAVDIRPLESGEILSVELEEGDMICVTERSDPDIRMCVPRVHEEAGEP